MILTGLAGLMKSILLLHTINRKDYFMKIPRYLKKGGTIGFVAPSFGCNIEPYKSGFDSALKKFSELGYNTDIGPNCYEGCGIGISNTPEKCGEEINKYFCDGKVDTIISCGGGELMCEVLDYIDFDKIKNARPTWYMGFSDNTNLTFLLPTLCDIAAIYAPCAPAFGMSTWHQSIHDAYHILTGEIDEKHGYDMWEKESLKTEENPLVPYNVTEKRELKIFSHNESEKSGNISVSGRLIGGCLDCLSVLTGTVYDKVWEFSERYKEDGIIWFIESCELNNMSMRRAMWQLEHAGWFENVKAFLIGRPMYYGNNDFGLDHYHAFYDILEGYNVPVIMDLDIGHLPPMMPMISGAKANIEVKDNDIRIKYIR